MNGIRFHFFASFFSETAGFGRQGEVLFYYRQPHFSRWRGAEGERGGFLKESKITSETKIGAPNCPLPYLVGLFYRERDAA